MRIPIIAVLLVAACAGDSPPATGRCTGQLFQPCAEEHDCGSMVCQNFAVEAFQVCSQLCGTDLPACPDGSTCDDVVGTCKPAAPDECTL
jgi:hypothetical protein